MKNTGRLELVEPRRGDDEWKLIDPQTLTTIQEMRSAFNDFEDLIFDMEAQIREARHRNEAIGEYADAEWWFRLNGALRQAARRRNMLKRMIADWQRANEPKKQASA